MRRGLYVVAAAAITVALAPSALAQGSGEAPAEAEAAPVSAEPVVAEPPAVADAGSAEEPDAVESTPAADAAGSVDETPPASEPLELTPAAEGAAETIEIPRSIAVMQFESRGGITEEQATALGDLVVNLIRATGVPRVIGMSDVRATLEFEQSKQLLGCADDTCLASVAGALDIRWVVTGNIARFGDTWLLNLKLIDTAKVEVVRGTSRAIPGGQQKLIGDLPSAVQELLTGVGGLHDEGSMLFMRDRAGRWPIWFTIGALATIPPHRSKETDYPTEYAALSTLSQVYAGFETSLFFGYALFDWLSFGPRLGFLVGADVKNDQREFVGVEGAIEIQGMLPLNFWISPDFMVAAAVGHVWDNDREGGGNHFDMTTVALEIGLGGHVYFNENWFFGARVVATERVYLDIHDAGGTRLHNQMLCTAINLLLSVGYELGGHSEES